MLGYNFYGGNLFYVKANFRSPGPVRPGSRFRPKSISLSALKASSAGCLETDEPGLKMYRDGEYPPYKAHDDIALGVSQPGKLCNIKLT